jgi:Flp pilus assembly protein TadD
MNILTLLFCTLTAQPIDMDRSSLIPNNLLTPAELNASILRELRLPEAPQPDRSTGPISVARLTHKVPKNARDAFNRATEFAKKKQHADAVRELKRAVDLDPAFADAYNNLGVQHFLLNELAETETSLRRALDLDPSFVTAHINMAYLALTKGDARSAEQEAQRAIALGDKDGEAQRVLGLIKAPQQRQP